MGVAELLLKRKQEWALRNQIEGDAYRFAYAEQEQTSILPNGIIYEIMSLGTGDKPELSDRIRCHYHGTNVSGEVFDSSVLRGLPHTFTLTKLIKAWQEMLPLMPTGTKFRMVVPPELAYREQQLSKQIGPNSTLIFEIELLEIVRE